MNDDQFNKLMTLLVGIYQELEKLNNPEHLVDLTSLEELGFEFEEVPDGGTERS